MLRSLLKIAVFVVAIAALSYGAKFLLEEAQGGVVINVMNYEFNLGPMQSIIALVVLLIVVWVLIKFISFLRALWKFMNGDDTAISRFFARNREKRGYDALAQGMMALASGEGRLAMAKAEKADKYLDRPELTNLLTAQAAEMAGDRKKAEETYRKMVESEATRFVGVRGIMKQKLAEGDTDTAMKLAQKAFALKPKHGETQDTLLQLQAQKADWSGARKTLDAKLKSGHLPRDVHKRRGAVLALSAARKDLDADSTIEAREAAIEANRLSPDLVPAAVMAARSYLEKGQKKYAIRVLKKAYEAQPHPELAAAFAEIEPNETAEQRVNRFKAFTKAQSTHPETRMLEAELLIAAEDFPAAQRALSGLFDADPTARTAALMAAVERGQGADDSVVQGWLARAITSPRGPQWVCENCQHLHGEWQAVCENCGAFDTLSWKRPPEAAIALPGGAEMLPLLVGKPSEDAETEEVQIDVDVVEGTVEEAHVVVEESGAKEEARSA